MCFVERRWKDVRVGDFVRVLSNQIIPADTLLLHTSDSNGVCHMDTANQDGETSLKQRKLVPDFSAGKSAAYHKIHALKSKSYSYTGQHKVLNQVKYIPL